MKHLLRWSYNTLLFIFVLLMLPKVVWALIKREKYSQSFKQRLGLELPQLKPSDGKRIWIHAVSMGETKAAIAFVKRLQKLRPDISILFSTTTETGQEEARRSLPNLQAYFYLPLDFSWIITKFVRHLQPDLLILVEGDLWYNLVASVPKAIVINGKISQKSQTYLAKVPFFTKTLLSHISLFCVQNQQYADRFLKLGVDKQCIIVTGNLKLDQPVQSLDCQNFQQQLGINETDSIITIGSTHAPEEEELLTELEPLLQQYKHLKIMLVPRHPERFDAVAKLLEKKRLPFHRYSSGCKSDSARIILIDTMGILMSCYQVANLAIVGGSFSSKVGGHNIFEPASLGVPVLFGPHMESQRDLCELVVSAGAGLQVDISQLAKTVSSWIATPPLDMQRAGRKLGQDAHSALEKTWQAAAAQVLHMH